MIYKHNKLLNQTVKFPSLDAIGEQYTQVNGWEDATQEQIDNVNLQIVKDAKLLELQTIYSSSSTWEFTLKDVDGTLTQTSYWLLAKISTTPIFYDDKGKVVQKTFTVEKVFEIIDKINAKGFEILTAKKIITTKINSVKTALDIEQIDINGEFEKINKIIEIS